jgi:hypothetical protein
MSVQLKRNLEHVYIKNYMSIQQVGYKDYEYKMKDIRTTCILVILKLQSAVPSKANYQADTKI